MRLRLLYLVVEPFDEDGGVDGEDDDPLAADPPFVLELGLVEEDAPPLD